VGVSNGRMRFSLYFVRMSSSDAGDAAMKYFKTHWETSFQLFVDSGSARGGEDFGVWKVNGTFSRPTEMEPQPKSVVHVLFEVDLRGENSSEQLRFRLENSRDWRNGCDFHHAMLERVVARKKEVIENYRELVKDEFGATRKQISFEAEINEEKKIAEDGKVHLYEEGSDDEILPDTFLIGEEQDDEGDFDGFAISKDPKLIALRQKIFETVKKYFDLIDPSESGDLYASCLETIQTLGKALSLNREDFIICYGCISYEISELDQVCNTIKDLVWRRLSSPQYQDCLTAWASSYITTYSPETENTLNLLRKIWPEGEQTERVEEEKKAPQNESMRRGKLFQLVCKEEHLMRHKECNAIVALLSVGGAEEVLELPTFAEVEKVVREVRLAFARNAFLVFSSTPVGTARVEAIILAELLKQNTLMKEKGQEAHITPHRLYEVLMTSKLEFVVHSEVNALRAIGRFGEISDEIALMASSLARTLCSLAGNLSGLAEDSCLVERSKISIWEVDESTDSSKRSGAFLELVPEAKREPCERTLQFDANVANEIKLEHQKAAAFNKFMKIHGLVDIVGIRPVENEIELTAISNGTEATASFPYEQLARDLNLEDPSILEGSELEDAGDVLEKLREALYVDPKDAKKLLFFVPLTKHL